MVVGMTYFPPAAARAARRRASLARVNAASSDGCARPAASKASRGARVLAAGHQHESQVVVARGDRSAGHELAFGDIDAAGRGVNQREIVARHGQRRVERERRARIAPAPSLHRRSSGTRSRDCSAPTRRPDPARAPPRTPGRPQPAGRARRGSCRACCARRPTSDRKHRALRVGEREFRRVPVAAHAGRAVRNWPRRVGLERQRARHVVRPPGRRRQADGIQPRAAEALDAFMAARASRATPSAPDPAVRSSRCRGTCRRDGGRRRWRRWRMVQPAAAAFGTVMSTGPLVPSTNRSARRGRPARGASARDPDEAHQAGGENRQPTPSRAEETLEH